MAVLVSLPELRDASHVLVGSLLVMVSVTDVALVCEAAGLLPVKSGDAVLVSVVVNVVVSGHSVVVDG